MSGIRKSRRGERGVALVATLSLLFTAGLLVGALVVIAQISTINIAASAEIMRSNYIAEGAANRIRYLLEADREVFGSSSEETLYEDYDHDRYLPDTVDHEMLYYGTPVKFRIQSADSGFNMGSSYYQSSLNTLKKSREEDEEDSYTEAIDILAERIADYIDSDDERRDNGMETDDYEELDRKNLPRNSAIQFREELLWIPGAKEILPLDRDGRLTFVRLMDISGGSGSTVHDIYTANYTTLRTVGELSEEEAAKVMHALKIWRRDRTPLADQLDEEELEPLKSRFTWQPSSNYTIVIEQASEGSRPSARLVQSFAASGAAGPADGFVRFFEHLRY